MTPSRVPPTVTVGDCVRSAVAASPDASLREPEVEHLHHALRRHLDVGRLEVAVDDALLVRRVERLGHVARIRQRGRDGERAARDPVGQCLAGHKLQDQRGHPVVGLEAVDGADVGMIQRGQDARFALEPREPVAVGGERRRQELDRDLAPERRVAGPVHLTHPARAQPVENLVAPEPLPEERRAGARRGLGEGGGDGHRGRVQKAGRRDRLREQRFDVEPQTLIAGAGFGQIRASLTRSVRERRVIERFDPPPPIRRHSVASIWDYRSERQR